MDVRVVLRARRRARALPGGRARDAGLPATTAAGRSRAPRSTSACARPASRSAQALGREESPIHFVASLRIGSPPDFDVVGRRLEEYPWLQFKLDGTPDWDQALIDRLAATGAVASIDFKGAYKGTPVDVDTDPAFYRRIAETLPNAWLEDPDLTDPEADAVLEPYRHRITWDAPIHSIADIENLAFAPRTINVKPSRFGSTKELFAAYDYCAERGIEIYGGGQSELGVGRGQIQYLASVFHPAGVNDIAPAGYDWAEFPEGPAREPACPRPRTHRLSPADVESIAMPPKQRQIKMESKSAMAAMQKLETRSDEELRPRPASAPPRRRSSAPAPPSAWTPSARASTSAPRSPPPARRSACSCGGWPRPRSRWPSAPGDLKAAAEKLGQTPPTNRQLLALRFMGLVAPPPGAPLWLRARGILLILLLVILLLALGWAIVQVVALPFGGVGSGVGDLLGLPARLRRARRALLRRAGRQKRAREQAGRGARRGRHQRPPPLSPPHRASRPG